MTTKGDLMIESRGGWQGYRFAPRIAKSQTLRHSFIPSVLQSVNTSFLHSNSSRPGLAIIRGTLLPPRGFRKPVPGREETRDRGNEGMKE
jgi:hypothetical protein